MAHQAHNIPWTVLASNLRWVYSGPIGDCLELRPDRKPHRGKQLMHFLGAFARNIEEHSACERRKYADKYEPPDADDVILDAATVNRISRTVRRWRHTYKPDSWAPPPWACAADGVEECKCPVILARNRRASAFLLQYEYNPCYAFWAYNDDYFFSLEIVKTLLLHGEMDPIFRICSYPGIDLKHGWTMDECGCGYWDLGCDQLLQSTLMAYICLNVIYCFPQTWDLASGKSEQLDYRRSHFYQSTVNFCIKRNRYSEIYTYPHRQFFGVADNQAPPGQYPPYTDPPYRVIPTEYLPASDDVDLVRWTLCRKGLPVELALDVMEFAGYEAPLRVPQDPFHPMNRNELARYLKYCWQTLVRCDLLAKAIGIELHWKDLVAKCLVDLCGKEDATSKKWYKMYYDRCCDSDERYIFV